MDEKDSIYFEIDLERNIKHLNNMLYVKYALYNESLKLMFKRLPTHSDIKFFRICKIYVVNTCLFMIDVANRKTKLVH